MANTMPALSTKILILIILGLALSFYDLPVWYDDFQHADVQVAFLLAVSIISLGVFLKRRVIRISFETSEIGFGRGILLVAAAAILYVYGSYSSRADWFHFESLLLLGIGYVALRVGTSIIRVLSPLLAVFALAIVPFSAPTAPASSWLVLLLALFGGLAFVLFIGLRPKQLALPVLLILVALGAWVGSVDRGLYYLPFLIPTPLLLLALTKVRRFADLPSSTTTSWCVTHHAMPNGFCSFCGKKVANASTPENFGGWGLLAVSVVVSLLVISSLPMLTIRGAAVYDGFYMARGSDLTALPITPRGWQVNATMLNSWNPSNGTYETVRTYVPLVHPETSNYTVYYSVSPSLNVPKVPSGANVSGWKWVSSSFNPMGGFQGRLTTYTRGNTTMLSYGASRTMTFWSELGFVNDYVTIGYVREFKNPNVTADTSQFFADLQNIWMTSLIKDASYSDWTFYVSNIATTLKGLVPALEMLASLSLIGWVGYRVIRSEESLDRFYTAATLTREKSWAILLEMLKMPGRGRLGCELSGPMGKVSQDEVETALKTLAKDGLVRPMLVAAGDDVWLVWKVRT